jgi:hypothetical protein
VGSPRRPSLLIARSFHKAKRAGRELQHHINPSLSPLTQLHPFLLAPALLAIAGLASVSTRAGTVRGHPSRNFSPKLLHLGFQRTISPEVVLCRTHSEIMKAHHIRNFDKVTGITTPVAGLKKVVCFMVIISVVLSAYYLSLSTKANNSMPGQWRISTRVIIPYLIIALTIQM